MVKQSTYYYSSIILRQKLYFRNAGFRRDVKEKFPTKLDDQITNNNIKGQSLKSLRQPVTLESGIREFEDESMRKPKSKILKENYTKGEFLKRKSTKYLKVLR